MALSPDHEGAGRTIMNQSDRWPRVKDIFHSALARASHERGAFVTRGMPRRLSAQRRRRLGRCRNRPGIGIRSFFPADDNSCSSPAALMMCAGCTSVLLIPPRLLVLSRPTRRETYLPPEWLLFVRAGGTPGAAVRHQPPHRHRRADHGGGFGRLRSGDRRRRDLHVRHGGVRVSLRSWTSEPARVVRPIGPSAWNDPPAR